MWSIDLHTFTKKAAHTKGVNSKCKYNRHIEYLALVGIKNSTSVYPQTADARAVYAMWF